MKKNTAKQALIDIKEKIIPLAQEVAKILLFFYQQSNVATDFKNNDAFDPVTAADRAADDFLRKKIIQLFPDDLILSEENSEVPTDYSKRIWMVDPLDGTKEFINHTDGFAINIGLWSEGEILFGLVLAPVINRLFYAERGQGAFERQQDGSFKQIHVSTVTDLAQARLLTRTASRDYRPLDHVAEALPVKEKIADSRIKMCRIACGEAEVHLNTNYRGSKWDTLAPELIVKEAGGVVTDIEGGALDYRQPSLRWEKSFLVANNQIILKQILSAIKNRPTTTK